MLTELWTQSCRLIGPPAASTSAAWVMHLAFASGVIVVLTTQCSATGHWLSSDEHRLQNLGCKRLEQETLVLQPTLTLNCACIVSAAMLRVQIELLRIHIVGCLKFDMYSSLTSIVWWNMFYSSQHTCMSYQEEIVSPSCIMQVSHGIQALCCCLVLHCWELFSNSMFSLPAFLL